MATNLRQPPAADVAKPLPADVGPALAAWPAQRRPEQGSVWLTAGPTVLVLALLVLATAYAGAFRVGQWAPPALFILIVLLTLVLRGGALRLPDRWLALALAGAWGLAGWAALSVLWADAPGLALEGAGRLAMYAAILTLPLLAIGDVRALRVAAHGVIGGIALIALYALAKMLVDGTSIFLAGRLNGPVEYRNATALLFCLAYWPLIVLAATREQSRALRAVSFGFAELMLGLAFLTQSRGVVLGLCCGGAVALALGPNRVRRAWLALLGIAMLAVASPWLLTPYRAFDGGAGIVHGSDIAAAARALLVLVALATAVGFLLAVFDAGLRPASEAMGRVRAGARIALVAAVIVGSVGALAAVHGNPVHEVEVKWREFKSLETTSTAATRYTSAGGQRYDLWRVGLNELRANPVAGVGEGNYQFDYYRQRHSNRNLDDPHGVLFQIGGELGLIGLALFLLVGVGLLGSLRRWWRLAPLRERRTACGLMAAGATFIGQSLVDWMWRIPGLTALGMLCLAVAAALLARSAQEASASSASSASASPSASSASSASASASEPRPRVPRLPLGRLAAGTVLLGAVALTLSLYLSDFYIRRARAEIGHSPQAQLAAARSAARLDPWSTDPHYLEASAFESMGDRADAGAQLREAQRMEPANQVPLGLLGDFQARGGHYLSARVYYRRALALNPLDVGLRQLARDGGRPESP
jgi:O-Antigen ligase